jgi:hypothetical protein
LEPSEVYISSADAYEEGEQMRFMLFVCAEPDLELSPEDKAALPGEVEEWATELANRGIRLMGHVFEPIGQAKTIRRRNDLQVTDGPVNRADEPIAGFNLLECGTLEEAVEVSATHPMAKHGSLELRAIGRVDRAATLACTSVLSPDSPPTTADGCRTARRAFARPSG